MMATRAGSVDPGMLLQLLTEGRLSAADMTAALEHDSGLQGVAGHGDLRDVEAAAAEGGAQARLALAMFADRAAAGIAAMATALDTLDALVFTGGIGEHSAAMRSRIVERLAVLGLSPLPAPEGVADTADTALAIGPPAVLRIAAREDLVIARAAARLLA
jgi:acetate kinase